MLGMKNRKYFFYAALLILVACKSIGPASVTEMDLSPAPVSDFWKNATVYFLLTDRFANGDPGNDQSLGRQADGALLRSFEGGDLSGITKKIEEGYFNELGVDALWMTPVWEQIHGSTDEGTGKTYAYHGYWAKDWTAIDPNYGTEADFAAMVEAAHAKGIRILMDVVINHTGPVTDQDPAWPETWVRTEPTCTYQDMETTIECTLVDNLPDIRTDSNEDVELPPFLVEKWKKEGRLKAEQKSLDKFFKRTGFPRSPRHHIIKWVTDWVRKYGIDGYRIDTAKHTEAEIWAELKREAVKAFDDWRKANPEKVLDDEEFYMVGEVYGFGVGGDSRAYSYGTEEVDFYDYGYESLINFSFKSDANNDYSRIFAKYNAALNDGPLDSVAILNYTASHDDGQPFDPLRRKAFEAGTKLLLSPGGVQIYYGDESARPLVVEGAVGDANLRSFMNWADIGQDNSRQGLLQHWQKLGQFRQANKAVGAGVHQDLQAAPYLFSRTLSDAKGRIKNKVLVGLDWKNGPKEIPVYDTFAEGTVLIDQYSGQKAAVKDGKVNIDSDYGIVLLAPQP
jgi:alpha-amylase